jgi:prophage antirepressor-like protein
MASTKPKAQEFRDWLAGVSIAVQDTGGYLLNEAARDTAHADTRTSVPLPTAVAGGYASLIEAKMRHPRRGR